MSAQETSVLCKQDYHSPEAICFGGAFIIVSQLVVLINPLVGCDVFWTIVNQNWAVIGDMSGF